MKNLLFLFIFLISWSANSLAQKKIAFSGESINLNGWASDLTISGHDESYVLIEQGDDNESESAATHKLIGDVLEISLTANTRTMHIFVPKPVNLAIEMEDVVWETYFDREKESDWRKMKIEKIRGDIEFSADGYHLNLQEVSGSIAVVTYGNIQASIADLSNSELISLDTYWGNVEVKIPANAAADLVMRAKSGVVQLSPKLQLTNVKKKSQKRLTGQLNGGTTPIILHSEGGQLVSLDVQ